MNRTVSPQAGGFPNLSREYPEPPPPEPPAGTRLLVLVLAVGGPHLVNAILVTTGLWAGSKVMPRFATIPAGQLTGESMDGFNLPSAVHNMDNIRIKSLREISLDALKGCLGLEVTEINYGLITEIFKKLEGMSEVVVGCFFG